MKLIFILPAPRWPPWQWFIKHNPRVVQIKAGHSFGPVSIGAYKAATMLKVPDKLLNDSVFDLEAYISKGLMHWYCEVGTQADMDRF